MAREGTPVNTGIDKGPARGLRSNVARNVALTVALLTAVVGTGAVISQKGGGGPSPETPPPSPIGVVVPPRSETPPPTIAPTEKPTPSPTERVLTNAEKIAIATKIQQEALTKGTILLPLPDIKNANINQTTLIDGKEIDILISAPANQEVIFPALIGGKILDIEKIGPSISKITISVDNRNINILFPSTGQALVKKGDTVLLGDALFKISNDPDSKPQQDFNSVIKDLGGSQGTIAAIGVQDITAGPGKGFGQLTLDNNVIKNDATNNPLTISSLQKQ